MTNRWCARSFSATSSSRAIEVAVAEDGEAALASFTEHRPDLVVLDLMLPRIDGLEVFRRMRADASIPVIMLTARGEETDRVVGLELGADDYVTKPFSPREVIARVRAVLRRTDPNGSTVAVLDVRRLCRSIAAGGRCSSAAAMSTSPGRNSTCSSTSPRRPGMTFTRQALLEAVWDFAWDGDAATVTVHIRRLREKIEADPSEPRHIVTVWGVGYRFEP